MSSTLKIEAICSSETSAESQRTTRRHIPEDGTLHNHRCENLKSYSTSCLINEHPSSPGDRNKSIIFWKRKDLKRNEEFYILYVEDKADLVPEESPSNF
jgi:hypothetical protein